MARQHATFFAVLPNDAKYSLGLYLSMKHLDKYCSIISCSDALWEFLIRKQLGFEKRQYLPTTMPLRDKFLELKSIRGVDFHSERFLLPNECIARASRLPDRKLATGLVRHFLDVVKGDARWIRTTIVEMVNQILEGAAAVGDGEMVRNYHHITGRNDPLVIGYAEAANLQELFQHVNAGLPRGDMMYALWGFAQGGHLALFQQFESSVWPSDLPPMIVNAARFDRWGVVDYIIEKHILGRRESAHGSSLYLMHFFMGLASRGRVEQYIHYFEVLREVLPDRAAEGCGMHAVADGNFAILRFLIKTLQYRPDGAFLAGYTGAHPDMREYVAAFQGNRQSPRDCDILTRFIEKDY